MSHFQITLSGKSDRARAADLILKAVPGTRVTFKDPQRTADQNTKLWAVLTDVSMQATLNGNQYDPEDWKLFFMSALSRELKLEMRIARGIYGEPVNLGRSSSKLGKKVFSDLIEFIHSWGAENGVVFKDPRAPPIESYQTEHA